MTSTPLPSALQRRPGCRAARLALVAAAGALTLGLAQAQAVDFTFTGQLLSTSAEQTFPGVWGVDAYGNNIIGQTFTATVHYLVDPNKVTLTATSSADDERPGPSSATFTVLGHTYAVDATTALDPAGGIQAYARFGNYINVTVSADHNDNTGVFFQFPYAGGSIDLFQSMSGDVHSVPELVTFPGAGDVVIGVSGAGVLRGNFSITGFTVTAVPEPTSWALLGAGLAVVVGLGRRRLSRAAQA